MIKLPSFLETISLPEYYTADHSRPPNHNFADYPIRVDGATKYNPKNDPRFPILTKRFITNNDLISHRGKVYNYSKKIKGILRRVS